jgi:hypothetical protein
MARITQRDLLHQWCNRGVHGYMRASNLAVTNEGKVLTYDGTVVGVHLAVDGVLITLFADSVDKPSRSRVSPYWIPGEIRRGMPSDQHHAVRVSKHVMGYRLDWLSRQDDHAILRQLGARMVTHWGECGRDDGKLAKMKAKRYSTMRAHQDECTERANTLALINSLTGDRVQELAVYRNALLDGMWTESEMEVAQVYSDKWKTVDACRVTEHGAFGRDTWEKRQAKRNARRDADIAKEAKEREYWTPDRIAQITQAWKDGGTTTGKFIDWVGPIPYWVTNEAMKVTLLRISGNEVETSRGARVGIRAAKRLLDMCERVWATGVDLIYTWENQGPKVGVYQLQYINQTEVVIGCHTLLRSTIEAFKPVFMEHAARLRQMDTREDDILADELRPILQQGVSD